ncbi:hypothetical protein TNCV_159021 [Trichonephila clavipes]|uniref:Uncharacterized protein n=1 Tax=Trichonephila clavipes TaxID=2585209 RepID=A0A8X6R4Q8_TRICX|nr:hypothetical protein TNCV_159021 [Trichonephila clavipes]
MVTLVRRLLKAYIDDNATYFTTSESVDRITDNYGERGARAVVAVNLRSCPKEDSGSAFIPPPPLSRQDGDGEISGVSRSQYA